MLPTILRSPITYAVGGYIAAGLALLCQEAVLAGHLVPGSHLSEALGITLFAAISLAPAIGVILALWYIPQKCRVWESVLAIVVAAPMVALLLAVGSRLAPA